MMCNWIVNPVTNPNHVYSQTRDSIDCSPEAHGPNYKQDIVYDDNLLSQVPPLPFPFPSLTIIR
jgi:hypothetical protein